MQLSENAKKCMKFLSVKAVYEYAKPEISLETFYKALQGRGFSRETIEKLEYAIMLAVDKINTLTEGKFYGYEQTIN